MIDWFWCYEPTQYWLVGIDINITVLTWKSNSRRILCCMKPIMAHDQDLLFDKLGVRTDGGHISDVKHFPACKYSLDKTWQSEFTLLKDWTAFPKSSTVHRSLKKWSNILLKAAFREGSWNICRRRASSAPLWQQAAYSLLRSEVRSQISAAKPKAFFFWRWPYGRGQTLNPIFIHLYIYLNRMRSVSSAPGF